MVPAPFSLNGRNMNTGSIVFTHIINRVNVLVIMFVDKHNTQLYIYWHVLTISKEKQYEIRCVRVLNTNHLMNITFPSKIELSSLPTTEGITYFLFNLLKEIMIEIYRSTENKMWRARK